MIKSWQHKGLEAFFTSGNEAGIRPDHAPGYVASLRVSTSRADRST